MKLSCSVRVDPLQAHWWAILLVILTLSAVMGCTVCLCGRKLDTDDLEWTPPSDPRHHHDDRCKRINLSGIFKCHGHVEEVVCTCECPVMHVENIAVAANREVSRPLLHVTSVTYSDFKASLQRLMGLSPMLPCSLLAVVFVFKC